MLYGNVPIISGLQYSFWQCQWSIWKNFRLFHVELRTARFNSVLKFDFDLFIVSFQRTKRQIRFAIFWYHLLLLMAHVTVEELDRNSRFHFCTLSVRVTVLYTPCTNSGMVQYFHLAYTAYVCGGTSVHWLHLVITHQLRPDTKWGPHMILRNTVPFLFTIKTKYI